MSRYSTQRPDHNWLIDIKNHTIARVPDRLRNKNNDAFSPHLISIGPFHYDEKHLLAMEQDKKQYTLSLLDRTRDHTAALEACCDAARGLKDEVGRYYYGVITAPDFARMLLYDGCFILELLLRVWHKSDGRGDDDPIVHNPRMITLLQHDLALVENQIPLVVLERLFEVITGDYRGNSYDLPSPVVLALRFFKLDPYAYRKGRDCVHLLDLIHDCYYGSFSPIRPIVNEESDVIKSATKLSSEDGVKFERGSSTNPFELKFGNGVMTIPQLSIEKSLFENLIAMEQLLRDREQYMTSYGLFMDYLIDTPEDVEFLVKKGIIPHSYGDYAEVAQLFNNICKQVVVRNFYYAGICQQLDAYCNSPWNMQKHIKSLIRDYCRTPWMVIGVVSAFILLGLTVVQTIYSILSYKK